MRDFFQNGHGHAALGRFAGEAVATCQRIEETIYRIAGSATHSGDVSKARAVARRWAREHPVGQAISGRESTLSGGFGRHFGESLSFGQAATEVTTTLDDLSRKLDVNNERTAVLDMLRQERALAARKQIPVQFEAEEQKRLHQRQRQRL
jgi:hypothetical protein